MVEARALQALEKEGTQRVFSAEARFALAKAGLAQGDQAGARGDADAAQALFAKVGTARAHQDAAALAAWRAGNPGL